ncbi:MAG: chemotaxis protein CheA, partial [Symploca sp. SIO3E6]|nr:chemotaxis protein CheA [Caldora sp. SIO3E6]
MQLVAHAGENLLSHLRDRQISINPQITSALLLVVDALQQLLNTLEATGEEGDTDYTQLLERLAQLQQPEEVGGAEGAGGAGGAEGAVSVAERSSEAEGAVSVAERSSGAEGAVSVAERSSGDGEKEIRVSPSNIESLEPSPELSPTPEEQGETTSVESHPSTVVDTSIRLDVSLLDKLMNLVGELVLSRNQIIEFANKQAVNKQIDPAFLAASQRLNIVTSELQEGVMKTRLQPIRKIWSKFPRVVRDLAISLGKQVQLEMEGEDTELDKTLIEAIADPLTHLVRNCVDHGIEAPGVRTAAGKPAAGRLFLRAGHESGHVNIEIADDGAGINSRRIKELAVQRGILTQEKANRISEAEALNLIFLPSFSTAEQVTNLSGRGVGMDVVRTNIEKISGTVDVQSRLGKGTSFKLKIPLTLAIIPAMIITSGGDRYAIPQLNLVELVRLEGNLARRGIEMVHGAPVYRLRGRLLPLVYLNQELKLNQEEESELLVHSNAPPVLTKDLESSKQNNDILNIVVLQATDKPFGLIVDAINDTQEIVVKPLGKQLKGISCFAGATIMGDGKVALILDVQGLAQKANLLSEKQKQVIAAEENDLQQNTQEQQRLLLFQGPNHRRMAIPLSHVARLEEFSRDAIERIGNQDVIQYRQQIMPLIYLSAALEGSGSFANINPQPVSVENKIQFVVVSLNEEKQ